MSKQRRRSPRLHALDARPRQLLGGPRASQRHTSHGRAARALSTRVSIQNGGLMCGRGSLIDTSCDFRISGPLSRKPPGYRPTLQPTSRKLAVLNSAPNGAPAPEPPRQDLRSVSGAGPARRRRGKYLPADLQTAPRDNSGCDGFPNQGGLRAIPFRPEACHRRRRKLSLADFSPFNE